MLDFNRLSDCIILLYRETLVKDNDSSTSIEIIKKLLVLSREDKKKAVLGGETDYKEALIMLLEDMCDNLMVYNQTVLLDKLKIINSEKPENYTTLESIITKNLNIEEIKKTIIALQKNILNYSKKYELSLLISSAYKDFVIKDLDVKTRDTALNRLVAALESINDTSGLEDPGLVDEVDFRDVDKIEQVATKVVDKANATSILKTGWGVVNRILQGGFRRGEMWMIDALQHNYKSGFSQSLVAQLAIYNQPVLENPDKKPLIIYVSLEDNVDTIIEFIFKYLYTNRNEGKVPDMKTFTSKDISNYITKEMGVNGYHVKMVKADPTKWTYMDLFNKINKYESEGYEIHVCIVDYLAKLPTTGCVNTGPGGTDVRDLFQRCRSFFSNKNICFITPHQLSTDAKQLIRNGIKEDEFVKHIKSKGYTELSKQLDQVVDGELYIHIATKNREKYLTIQRGKHRIPSILSDDDQYGMIKFQPKIPLQDNLEDVRYDGSGDDGSLSELMGLVQ